MPKLKNNLDTWLAIILLVATVITIVLQIVFSGATSTKLETSLFSILQFVFALAFSWLIARASLRQEFQESQKKFAISAYRRITEISMAVERVLYRTNNRMQNTDSESHHELDIVCEITRGIRESIKSSTADWADIIGDEIVTVEKIQALREQQARQEWEAVLLPESQSDDYQEKIDNVDEDEIIEELLSLLPQSLKITADKRSSKRPSKYFRKQRLREEEERKGFIELEGFSESGFESDIYNYAEGDILSVRIGDVGSRIGALVAYDSQDRSVGLITNKLSETSVSYIDGIHFLMIYVGRSEFDIEILSIERGQEESKRHYFTAKILPAREKMNRITKNSQIIS